MMQRKKKNRWNGFKLILFIPILLLLLQAFAKPETIIEKASEFAPITLQDNKTEKWLERWTIENIGNGFFQPKMKPEDSPKTPNNNLVILMNSKNNYLIENRKAGKEEINKIVKYFLNGESFKGGDVPNFIEKELPIIGKIKISKGVISYKYDKACSVEAISFTLNEIGKACLEVRQEKAEELFGKSYFLLSNEKKEVVENSTPIWFSVDEPKIVKPPPPPPPRPITKTVEQPLIKVGKKWLTLNNKKVEISELSKTIEKQINKSGSRSTVELQIRDNISKERIEKVNRELNKIAGIKIIRKNFTPPPPPPIFLLKLYNNKITLWNKEIKMSEVSEKAKEYRKRYGKDRVISVKIENNINAERLTLLKDELRKAEALNINMSSMK